jgi:putative ABC transport system permease protein
MISIPAGVLANQKTANTVASNLSNIINQTGATINQTDTQIDCSLAPSFSGFGFGSGASGSSGSGHSFTFGGGSTSGGSGFTPGQFGGGTVGGYFGGGAFGGGQASPMNESLYTDISSISGVAAVEPILKASEGTNVTQNLSFNGYTRTITRLDVEYTIEGIPLTASLVDNYPILPTNITAGGNLQAGDSGVVLLSENNSAYFGAGVGDTVTILGQSFTVAGIYSPSSVADTQTLYMNLSDAQAITNNTGYITSLTVFAQNSGVVSQVASSISTLHPELTVTTAQNTLSTEESSYATALATANASDSQTNSTAIEEIVVVVLATSLIVLFVMLYTVKERTKEIGTLKAIGFSNSTVMSQFMLEGVLLSMLAGIVGIAIGSIAAPTLASKLLPSVGVGARLPAGAAVISGTTRFGGLAVATLTPELVLLGFGVAILLGTLGSLYPAWRAAKIRPAEAMRYE